MPWHERPILCLYRAAGEPLRRYLREVLMQEGYVCVDHLDLDDVERLEEALAGRALVIVSAATLDAAEAAALAGHVRGGGRAVFVRPPASLVEALGLGVVERPHRIYGDAPPAYLRVAEHPWSAHHAGALIQVQAPTVLWKIDGPAPLALVAANRDETSVFPAVGEATVGEGRAAVFWFDLGCALVLARQGDPRRASNSGWPREDAGVVKPGSLFYGHLDPALRHVPQADVLADLLVGVIRGLTDDLLPLPRIWHFPGDSPALTLLDGDSDGYDWQAYEDLVAPCLAADIPYTLNLMPRHLDGVDRAAVAAWMKRGNDFQLHYHYDGWAPSVDDLARAVPKQQRQFREAMDGRVSVGSRAHSVLWPGYTEPAEIYAANGARMETNFMPFRGCQYGYCGSARAGRYMTLGGRTIELSQQPTVFMDDPMSNDKSVLPARTAEQAYDIVTRFYDDSARRYHGVICTCLHPVAGEARAAFRAAQGAMRHAVIDATRAHGLRAMTMAAWCGFQEARRRVTMRCDGAQWGVRAEEAIAEAMVHVPAADGVARQGFTWRAAALNLAAGETISVRGASD